MASGRPYRGGYTRRWPIAVIVALIATSTVLLVWYGLTGYSHSQASSRVASMLPKKMGEFMLTSRLEGAEALERTRQMHLGSLTNVMDVAIGLYQRGDGAVVHLWLASYPSPEEAEGSLKQMVEKMRESPELGYRPYAHPLDGRLLYVAAVKGSLHVFWAQDKQVWYALASGMSFEDTLNSLKVLIG